MTALMSIRLVDGGELELGVEGSTYCSPDSLERAEAYDVRKYWALAGLADCHAHLSVDSLEETDQWGQIDAIRRRAFTQLEAGVFLVIDKGWRDGTVLRLLSDPPQKRPHLEAAGRLITGRHGYFPGFAVETDGAGLSDAVRAADLAGGWVKLVGDWPQKGRGPVINFGEEALAGAVAIAHSAGVRVAIHTMAPETPGMAVRAGVDSIEHGLYMTESDLICLSEREGAWVPTVANVEDVMSSLGAGSSGVRILGEGLENVRRLLPLAAELGSTVLCGTDLGLAHGQVAREAVRLHDFGLGARETVAAATASAYRYLGRLTLQTGADADLVLFADNPVDDPTALTRPVAGMRAGRVVFDRTGLLPSLP
ncbi:MAG TPA: amidohydrolase family protein [Acidimicrobiia bacterium]|nr:amidohydrolase family protein [Acidimicrobiia bacterium]